MGYQQRLLIHITTSHIREEIQGKVRIHGRLFPSLIDRWFFSFTVHLIYVSCYPLNFLLVWSHGDLDPMLIQIKMIDEMYSLVIYWSSILYWCELSAHVQSEFFLFWSHGDLVSHVDTSQDQKIMLILFWSHGDLASPCWYNSRTNEILLVLVSWWSCIPWSTQLKSKWNPSCFCLMVILHPMLIQIKDRNKYLVKCC